MKRYPFALRLGTQWDLDAVSGLVREAAEWLRTSKNTDQGRDPRELAGYPSQALFEREAGIPESNYNKLFLEEERKFR